MNVYLIRNKQGTNCTFGILTIPGQEAIYTLEPKTPILEGTFRLTPYRSPKFSITVPLLNETPGHTYVEIHIGNFASDTRDCILVGNGRAQDYILHSTEAFTRLSRWFLEKVAREEIFIKIINQIPITTR